MSDLDLQALRRRVASGDATAATPLLVARLRSGDLSLERAQVAALCGHVGAQDALEPPPVKVEEGYLCCCGDVDVGHSYDLESYTHSAVHACDYYKTPCTCEITVRYVPARRSPVPPTVEGLVERLRKTLQHNDGRLTNERPMVLANLAAARVVLDIWTRNHDAMPYRPVAVLERASDVLVAVKWWLDCPCDSCMATWSKAWLASSPAAGGHPENDWLPRPIWWQSTSAINCAKLAPHVAVFRAMREALIAWALA